jgi:hypothetical protein
MHFAYLGWEGPCSKEVCQIDGNLDEEILWTENSSMPNKITNTDNLGGWLVESVTVAGR